MKTPSIPTYNSMATIDVESTVSSRSERAQWLRAAVLGASDGLLSTASLIIGIGALGRELKTMVLTGAIGLLAGALSMGIGEFVSVSSQYDIELSRLIRENKAKNGSREDLAERMRDLPRPFQAAAASAVSFATGACVPLLGAFLHDYIVRICVVVVMVSASLIGFGWLAATLGRSSPVKSTLRMLAGGWVAMGVTYGLSKLVGFIEKQSIKMG